MDNILFKFSTMQNKTKEYDNSSVVILECFELWFFALYFIFFANFALLYCSAYGLKLK